MAVRIGSIPRVDPDPANPAGMPAAAPCRVEDDPDFRLLDRATAAAIAALALYMAGHFAVAWFAGRL